MTYYLNYFRDETLAMPTRGNHRGSKATTATPAGGIRKRPYSAATQKVGVSTINTTKMQGFPTGPSGKVVSTKIIISNLVWPLFISTQRVFF